MGRQAASKNAEIRAPIGRGRFWDEWFRRPEGRSRAFRDRSDDRLFCLPVTDPIASIPDRCYIDTHPTSKLEVTYFLFKHCISFNLRYWRKIGIIKRLSELSFIDKPLIFESSLYLSIYIRIRILNSKKKRKPYSIVIPPFQSRSRSNKPIFSPLAW